jgi:dephospho-CoA kinase
MLKLNATDNPQLILITGSMAAGKSTAACFVWVASASSEARH